jgi:hypothetical protein
MIKPVKRYRPERHYMRGPGPKWLEKHGGGIDQVDAISEGNGTDKRVWLQTSSFSLREAGRELTGSPRYRRNSTLA